MQIRITHLPVSMLRTQVGVVGMQMALGTYSQYLTQNIDTSEEEDLERLIIKLLGSVVLICAVVEAFQGFDLADFINISFPSFYLFSLSFLFTILYLLVLIFPISMGTKWLCPITY